MSVQVMQQGGGGGWFSSLLPQLLSIAGGAVAGPAGAAIGGFGGNLINGRPVGESLGSAATGLVKSSLIDPVKVGLSGENVTQNALKDMADPTGRSQFPSRYDDYMKYLGRNADWTDTDQLKYDNLLKQYGLYRR